MKSRELNTIHDVIVTDYSVISMHGGRALHRFHPLTTATVYEFEGINAPVLKEGARYNIGYTVTADGRRIIEPSALAPTDEVNPLISFHAAKEYAVQEYDVQRGLNDRRVAHSGTGDYYWGKKYAWRIFGAAIAKNAFYAYLAEIAHLSIPCVTSEEGFPPAASIAYAETGLEEAMYALLSSATPTSNGQYFQSPVYTKRFAIEGVNAITHKK